MQKPAGFHLELTNLCTLRCPECMRTGLIERLPKYWKNYSIELNDLKRFFDIDLRGLNFLICGQYGDAIYHPNFLEIIAWLKDQGTSVTLHTNGSYRTKLWWEMLGSMLDSTDCVVFSIDGMPDNFTKYRINADWPSIELGIKTLATMPVKTQWKYIVFNYNEHTIDQARALAKDLGINEFVQELSDRFENNSLQPSMQYVDPRFYIKPSGQLKPRCHDQQQHYISAEGYYMPCCHIGHKESWLSSPFSVNRKHYDIRSVTLTQALESAQEFYINIEKQPLKICQLTCSTNEAPICNPQMVSILN